MAAIMRQTNDDTLSILEEQDSDLVPKMRASMKQIFQKLFLPVYRTPYRCNLYISRYWLDISVRLRVLPLTDGSFQVEETPHFPHDYLDPHGWRTFHDEVFRGRLQQGMDDSFAIAVANTLDHEDWHPYLASYLLNTLAVSLYRRINPKFSISYNILEEELDKESFAYILECLPYAKTTQSNLDSLRAIAYLYLFPNANLEWTPPLDFWSLSLGFLKVSTSASIICL